MERAAFRARLHCLVAKEWLRLGLKSFAQVLTAASDAETVEVSFDGSILTFRCSGRAIPMSATGEPWPACFQIPAVNLRRLPKRLKRDELEVSVYDGHLRIDRYSFGGIEMKPS